VNPEILIWARETAGLSLEKATKALGLSAAHGLTAVDRLKALESGDEPPTRALLLKMSKQYRRSLLNFYLSAPPRKGDRGQDFRTVPPDRSITADALLDALIRDLKARQNLVRSVLEDEEDMEPLPFVGSAKMADGVMPVLHSIQKTLGISLSDYRSRKTADDAFASLRDSAESAGIFVLLIGNLGSHHSAIPVEVFRGFAIADAIAPFVVINDQDAKTAWSFTLLHEIAHLWLGTTGVSGARAEIAIEQFCNDVASEFLLPTSELGKLNVDGTTSVDDAIPLIAEFAKDRHISRMMVAYKLYRVGIIAQNTWRTLNAKLQEIWLQEKATRKESSQKSDSGPNYYVVRRHRLGSGLLSFVNRTMNEGMLTPVKAAKVLGVKPRNVYHLLGDTQYFIAGSSNKERR
jgi:Zn-dependent peptidase ImmA (M78 family)/transcriptional regulator with XRE-family HTH domain